MRKLTIYILLFWFSDAFSQIEYFNHNDCDKYTIREWNIGTIDSLNIPSIPKRFSISNQYNFSDSLKNLTIIKRIKSNILINGLILFNQCFEKNCSCEFNKKLDTLHNVMSSISLRLKIIGFFKPFPNVYSLIIVSQLPRDTTEYWESKEMSSYLVNFDSTHKVISTSSIGHFRKINDGFSYSEVNSEIKIKNNIVKMNVASMSYPTDMIIHFSNSKFREKHRHKIRILKSAQIEIIK
jgi:hypothetical protein